MSAPKDLHARVPVDAVAARVTRPGIHFTADRNPASLCSDTPLPTRRPNKGELMNAGSFTDLTGVVRHHLTVIGISAEMKEPLRWVCRCVCGQYCHRTARTLRRLAENKCDRCAYHDRLLRKATYIATGVYDHDKGI